MNWQKIFSFSLCFCILLVLSPQSQASRNQPKQLSTTHPKSVNPTSKNITKRPTTRQSAPKHKSTLTFQEKLGHYNTKRQSFLEEIVLGWAIFTVSYGLCALEGTIGTQSNPFLRSRLLIPFIGPFIYGLGLVEKGGAHHGTLAIIYAMPWATLFSAVQIVSAIVAITGHVKLLTISMPKRKVAMSITPWFHHGASGLAMRGSF